MISGGGYPSPRDFVWVYNFEKEETEDRPSMNTARALHGAVTTPKGVYVFGGNGDEQEPIASAERLKGEWEDIPEMPEATSAAVAVEAHGKIFITGHCIYGILEYDPSSQGYR